MNHYIEKLSLCLKYLKRWLGKLDVDISNLNPTEKVIPVGIEPWRMSPKNIDRNRLFLLSLPVSFPIKINVVNHG